MAGGVAASAGGSRHSCMRTRRGARGRMTFPTSRPKARPGKSAGIPKPNLAPKRYAGFVLENQETGRANAERRRAMSKAAV